VLVRYVAVRNVRSIYICSGHLCDVISICRGVYVLECQLLINILATYLVNSLVLDVVECYFNTFVWACVLRDCANAELGLHARKIGGVMFERNLPSIFSRVRL